MDEELQELNEKLARWAGFVPCGKSFEWPNQKGMYYHAPAPDFTSSLDAQVKWLWPKLIFCEILMPIFSMDGNFKARVAKNTNKEYISYANTPALAAARAIEQLIDNGR